MRARQRDQPEGLLRAGAARADATVHLVEQALALLAAQQADLPPERRRFSTSAIIAAAAKLRPDASPLQRSTLGRNPAVRQMIAEARRQELPTPPDFEQYGGWSLPRGTSFRHHSRRRAVLSRWSVPALAEHVVGLEELERHCAARRQQFEAVDWTSGPWPGDQPYPSSPFQPSSAALERYERYRRQRTRGELVEEVLRLEQLVAEHRAHLLLLDHEYVRHRLADTGR